ncbi:hypothetical protein HDU93_000900 [Gonapodya sp. JEL0774]|nr:hypothetical protein HDU93_000900 [Gonapodya sp. JEL0774]
MCHKPQQGLPQVWHSGDQEALRAEGAQLLSLFLKPPPSYKGGEFRSHTPEFSSVPTLDTMSQEEAPTWAPKEEQALLRKIDYRIIPLASAMYFMAYLDRVNIGNAKVSNSGNDTLEKTLNLDTAANQYNWCLAIFFIPYCIFEVPSNFALRYFGPRIWLARIMLSWSIISLCQAFSQNFTGLMICRTLLGAAEAGLFPGVLYLFTFWYRKHEISTRVAVLFSFNSIAGAFSGLLASGWCTAHFFLSPREIEIAVARLPTTAASVTEKTFDLKQFKETMKDPILSMFLLASLFLVLPSYGVSYFRPSIISGMGFTGDMSNLMSAWPSVFTAVIDQYWGWRSDKVKERPWHIIASVVTGAVGNALLVAGQILLWPAGVRYFFLFISALSSPGLPILFVYRANTIKGTTAQAIAMGLTIAVGNIGGFLAPFVYLSSWSPLYINAIWISMALQLACGGVVFIISKYEQYKIRTDPEWATEIASGIEKSTPITAEKEFDDLKV